MTVLNCSLYFTIQSKMLYMIHSKVNAVCALRVNLSNIQPPVDTFCHSYPLNTAFHQDIKVIVHQWLTLFAPVNLSVLHFTHNINMLNKI